MSYSSRPNRSSKDHLVHDLRILSSGCAALLASLLCHNLAHFTIIPTQPSTWYLATQHRCGWTLIATVTWFLAEIITRIYAGISTPRKTQPPRLN